jgi:hypothetical protein
MAKAVRAAAAAAGVTLAAGYLFSQPGASFRIVRGPYLQPGPAGSLAVVWYTDPATRESKLQWRKEGGAWVEERLFSEEPTERREILLSRLQEGLSYSYRVVERDTAVANLAAQTEFSFHTPISERLKFVAFGDSGSGNAAQRAVAQSISKENPPPDLALLTGDVVYPHGADSDYDAKFFVPFGSLLSRMPFYSAIGNHDYETRDGAPYLEVFSLPLNGPNELAAETVYWFEQSGVFFTVHDSNLNSSALNEVVAPWHVAAVRGSKTRFRVAALHHSPYSSASNSTTAAVLRVREFFPSLFTATGVDLVLGGHDHVYERTRPIDGVVYITTGAGGASLYPRIANNDYTEVFYGEGGRHGHTTIEVSGANLALRHTDTSGCIVDRVGMYKPIGEGDSWRIYPGIVDPPADWAQPGFQDRAWSQAALPIGFGTPDVASTPPDMPGDYLTLYARTTFALAPGRVNQVLLRIRYDDGFVAYLNGTEVARRNVPERQTAHTPAVSGHAGEWFETIELPLSATRVGTNVLAIEGHNRALESSSFLLAPELTLVASDPGRCR